MHNLSLPAPVPLPLNLLPLPSPALPPLRRLLSLFVDAAGEVVWVLLGGGLTEELRDPQLLGEHVLRV